MATNKQIIKAAREFEELQQQLQDLKDKKQMLQTQLMATQSRIDELQLSEAAALSSLKTLVNEV
jgi:response regulator of citrate/malate metabolism